jgi:hypothetical protein
MIRMMQISKRNSPEVQYKKNQIKLVQTAEEAALQLENITQ